MASYIETCNHNNRIGVLIEFSSRDDIALRTEEFKSFAHNMALHIAASGQSELPLVSQAYIHSPEKTVGDQFVALEKLLGSKVSIARYEYYAAGDA